MMSGAWRAAVVIAGLSLVGCPREPAPAPPCGPTAAAALPQPPSDPASCVLHLHGKSGTGAATARFAGLRHVCPAGNAEGWGGRQWLYFPEPRYREMRDALRAAIAKSRCDRVIVHGFSNGAAAAAKLYCRGESFQHKVVGYVLEDPVPDHGVDACRPDPALKLRLYWTGALQQPVPGWRCAERDWTCEGDQTIGIAAYARALGTVAVPSIHRTHRPQESPPEYGLWLAPAAGASVAP